ncbi:hypothetical protein [Azospirillum thermophilum]|uniref:hypothetical protein n=1 Tax=Azospirillum thermophilum TaxID=2202148 RepID=UPI00143D26FA|nr:hypothetical protein [Azospirillum thermophilum]
MPEEVNDRNSPGKEKIIAPPKGEGGAGDRATPAPKADTKPTPTPPVNPADPNLRK